MNRKPDYIEYHTHTDIDGHTETLPVPIFTCSVSGKPCKCGSGKGCADRKRKPLTGADKRRLSGWKP